MLSTGVVVPFQAGPDSMLTFNWPHIQNCCLVVVDLKALTDTYVLAHIVTSLRPLTGLENMIVRPSFYIRSFDNRSGPINLQETRPSTR